MTKVYHEAVRNIAHGFVKVLELAVPVAQRFAWGTSPATSAHAPAENDLGSSLGGGRGRRSAPTVFRVEGVDDDHEEDAGGGLPERVPGEGDGGQLPVALLTGAVRSWLDGLARVSGVGGAEQPRGSIWNGTYKGYQSTLGRDDPPVHGHGPGPGRGPGGDDGDDGDGGDGGGDGDQMSGRRRLRHLPVSIDDDRDWAGRPPMEMQQALIDLGAGEEEEEEEEEEEDKEEEKRDDAGRWWMVGADGVVGRPSRPTERARVALLAAALAHHFAWEGISTLESDWHRIMGSRSSNRDTSPSPSPAPSHPTTTAAVWEEWRGHAETTSMRCRTRWAYLEGFSVAHQIEACLLGAGGMEQEPTPTHTDAHTKTHTRACVERAVAVVVESVRRWREEVTAVVEAGREPVGVVPSVGSVDVEVGSVELKGWASRWRAARAQRREQPGGEAWVTREMDQLFADKDDDPHDRAAAATATGGVGVRGVGGGPSRGKKKGEEKEGVLGGGFESGELVARVVEVVLQTWVEVARGWPPAVRVGVEDEEWLVDQVGRVADVLTPWAPPRQAGAIARWLDAICDASLTG